MSNQPVGQITNDFCITFSTINGSGSATANTILMRALFRMGIPVSGKNIFPSNIQGLPTWFTLRVNKDGFLARVEKDDILIAMNPTTIAKEFQYVIPGGVLLYPDDIKVEIPRDDITIYTMPVKQIIKEQEVQPKMRDYVANMVYVGILAQVLGIPLEHLGSSVEVQFKGKKAAVDANMKIIAAAYQWSAANIHKKDPYQVEPMHKTDGWVMMDGNTAGALGSIFGGVQFVGWYPITPASSLAEALHEYVPVFRKDPVEEGRETCVIVQAEDELAAIGMVVGAGWGGLRAMTSTSGPGISLMAEYLGLAYYTEVPVVVWNVQRVGPSTGMPTRTAQGDITQAYFNSHGDTSFIMLFPCSLKEAFEMGWKAFDIAERMQMPVMVMSDLDLGMNQWISPPFEYPDQPMDRGKILWEKDLDEFLEKKGEWGRYLDVDGDGIPYRTLPGNRHPKSAYFCRGTGHDEYAKYSEESEVWERVLDRLEKKFQNAVNYTPKPEIAKMDGARVGIIAYGSTEPAVEEARVYLKEAGLATDFLRIRSIPFHAEVRDFIADHDQVFVVEINRDGQMKQILTLFAPELATKLVKVAHTDGLPLTARWIKDEILVKEEK